MTTNINYADRFQQEGSVESYETGEYNPRSYSTFIWNLQQPVLARLVQDLRQNGKAPVRLLDFACGTGRIISSIETLVDDAEGIDISEKMVEVARRKCRTARLGVGDIIQHPALLHGPYDLITCFRFVLNVEPEIRRSALHRLRQVISEPNGRLIISVHGNSGSLRHLAIAWKRWRLRNASPSQQGEVMLNEMSSAEARELFRETGFEVVDEFGFGILPPTLYRTPLRRMAGAIDSFGTRRRYLTDRSIDLLFVCRPQ